MKRNPTHPGTYAGQPARLYVAAETSRGRKLFALRTPGGVLATAWDTARRLRRLAAERHLNLTIDSE
jgi:hypothetical protein